MSKMGNESEVAMRHVILVSVLGIFLATAILGCANTMRGAGKDIHKAGERMEKI